MSVFVTGDIHGDPRRLNTESFYEQKQFSGDKDENIVIILGDFGLIWSRDSENKQEKYYLDWLEQKPFTTVFVDGNHENHVRLATYPVKQWHGGLVHEIRPLCQHVFSRCLLAGQQQIFALQQRGNCHLQNLFSEKRDFRRAHAVL